MSETPTLEECAAPKRALSEAPGRNESLAGELRVTRTERDLLEAPLDRFK
ncbi:MAG: hypothetical protein O9345_20960 [Burkholderiaceae bacterium]|jgi:hypothetical protein|nr:hypothetical protein [Burkholderiales bacterium]MCZ8340591.1 hypothetical protein [Burkholderiaceae bacterium]